MIMQHHRQFLSAIRNVKPELQSTDEGFTASSMENVMSLDHISIGDGFVAIAGIFSDHAFLEYLNHQPSIDYVEQNSLYKTTDVNEERKIMTGKTTNWGLARIRQREKGNLEEYDFDTMGG